jgi:hypothetical protein
VFSVRWNDFPTLLKFDFRVPFIGVGDGIGRVWGLKNVQG